MKKLIVLPIIFIFIALQLSAQKSRDVIYLKNGSIIYGTLTEIFQGQYKIKGTDGSLFIFNADEVERYAKESEGFEGRKRGGLGFSLEGGFLVGAQSTEYDAPFSFNSVISYTTDTKNLLGIGTGAEFLGKTYTPLFFEYRRLFRDTKASPFLFFRSGVMLYLGKDDDSYNNYYPQYYLVKDYSGGATVTAGCGISWAGQEVETYLSFAYRYAQTSYVQSEYSQHDVTYKNNFNRLEIKFGFKF
jgi:hypothetical protein